MAATRNDHDLNHGMMSFGDHLEELRRRLVLAVAVPFPLAILLFFVASTIREILTQPALQAMTANGLPARMQALGPAEVLTTDLKLSLIGALVLSAPWILWQAWKFIEPGLYREEKRFVHVLIPGSAILTISGIAFLYWVMLPLMLQVLIAFGVPGPGDAFGIPDPGDRIAAIVSEGAPVFPVLTEPPAQPAPGQVWIDAASRSLMVVVPVAEGGDAFEILSTPLSRAGTISQEFRLGEYIGFVMTLALAIVVAFQMPLVILLLGWIGLVERETLRRQRRHALLICAVLGAVLTPADVVSMVLLFIPLYVLYELGILLLAFAPADRVASGTVLGSANASRTSDHAGRDGEAPTQPVRTDQTDRPEPSPTADFDPESEVEGPPSDEKSDPEAS
jgi:sec-independent protein translocase protein TatC